MKKILLIWFILLSLIWGCKVYACSAFCLKNGQSLYLAKNLDWPIAEGFVFINERGENKSVVSKEIFEENRFSWTSKYRSISFNQFGKEFPLGGMNEHGLVIEELNMPKVTFTHDSTKYNINEFQLTQYILDNCKTINEVVNELNKFQYNVLFQHLHYIVADRTHDVLIIEYDGLKFNMYYPNKTGFPILSNNNYNESLKYLQNFQGFGGNLPIKNREGSNERFVSIAQMLLHYYEQNPVEYAYQILDSIKQDDTQWSIVYDVENLVIHFKFRECNSVKIFDFNEFVTMKSVFTRGAKLSDCNGLNNNALYEISTEDNTQLIHDTFKQIKELIDKEIDFDLLYKMALMGNGSLKAFVPEKIIDELNKNITELPTGSPLLIHDEYINKITAWENYQVIALGEATHGTKEFCELKFRLFKFLVENKGFRILAYEYSFKKSLAINDYIVNGVGDIDTLLMGESWIQNNIEVKKLIEWMRNYNKNRSFEEKIHFIGIDNQLDAFEPYSTLECIEKKCPGFVADNNSITQEIKQLGKVSYIDMTKNKYLKLKDLYDNLHAKNKLRTKEKYSDTLNYSIEFATMLVQSLINSHEFLYKIFNEDDNPRDKQMANNSLALSKWKYLNKSGKIVIWAHNAHIASNPDYYGTGKASLGKYLKDTLGNKYLAVATSFSIGKFKAVMFDSLGNDTKPLVCEISETPAYTTTNYILHKAKYKNFVFRINELDSENLLFEYMNIKRPLISVGDLYLGIPEKHFTNDRIINLVESYDLFFYYTNTNPITRD